MPTAHKERQALVADVGREQASYSRFMVGQARTSECGVGAGLGDDGGGHVERLILGPHVDLSVITPQHPYDTVLNQDSRADERLSAGSWRPYQVDGGQGGRDVDGQVVGLLRVHVADRVRALAECLDSAVGLHTPSLRQTCGPSVTRQATLESRLSARATHSETSSSDPYVPLSTAMVGAWNTLRTATVARGDQASVTKPPTCVSVAARMARSPSRCSVSMARALTAVRDEMSVLTLMTSESLPWLGCAGAEVRTGRR